ncbi:DNA polymerase III subunit gamma/tau [Helicobacter ailurogastricus]|uniref:DNA polymerase III subunit gamma/tau n=1 Tax=Helicobacter ailurogastricus TaxID=1578720 RepID=A0A0K2XE90_9HELI|nr:DNA polymerase III subunit gamma/tau [Helicobacter ailurogastricus]CRF40920.1 DNA polymerase III subunits gamma and tau [Helicobacter ailurogastricus]CRF42828.1 DNA polymerase III subunits gamma and tau [Helicobacter ailurogastricus]CRF44396.1 DNA polymerase III subunits gamma and tau [Helicobacter ailurogastricus]
MSLALKYRPKHFEELVGQESVAKTLSLALESGRLAHAYLFSGLRGSGKTSSARIFARALQCKEGISATPCDACSCCVESLQGTHLDTIEMDGASNRRIEDVRGIIEQSKYKPSLGRFKIFIIDEVHMLTKEAFNALLKTLEEPPAHVKFILATTDPFKLPATILSRTQQFHFRKIPLKAVVAHLKFIFEQEGVGYEEAALEMLARSGGGSLRDTLTLAEQAMSFSGQNVSALATSQMLGLVDTKVLEGFFNALIARESVEDFLQILSAHDIAMVLEEMARFLKEAMFSQKWSISVLEPLMDAIAQARPLLNYGIEGDFVLALSTLKMQASLQNPAPPTDHRPAQAQPQPKPPAKPTPSHAGSPEELFQQFIAKIESDHADLGRVFREFVVFQSFKNGVLFLHSSATGPARQLLRQHYENLVVPRLREVFGANARIETNKTNPKPLEQFKENNPSLMQAMQDKLGTTDGKVEDC